MKKKKSQTSNTSTKNETQYELLIRRRNSKINKWRSNIMKEIFLINEKIKEKY